MSKVFFTHHLFDFLAELEKNNTRDWFNTNKYRYIEYVREPMLDFIEALGKPLLEISECFVADPRRSGGSMFRIYRDTRFSKDKTPYKTHVSMQLRHEAGRDAHAPGFYLQLKPGGCTLGGGIYRGDNAALNMIRERIVAKTEQWGSLQSDSIFAQSFGHIYGEGLKRVPRGFDKQHPCAEDLKRKTFFVRYEFDDELALSNEFISETTRLFSAASPFMHFITSAIGLRY
jgi:uncharacterized protein (TIGR02453 family)